MEKSELRSGYTTGSCAAGAARSSILLLQGRKSKEISIELPIGVEATLPIAWQECVKDVALTAIQKDGGDDPDVTSGLFILVEAKWQKRGIEILGGEGVGMVTKPGLPVPSGKPAINPVPQSMIRKEVGEVCPPGLGVELTVSILGGEKVAQKTFNPRLGIVGGLSILGTTGLVIPRSAEGFLGTINAELSVLSHQGFREVVLTPGNYGRQYARARGFQDEIIVSCGNFLGFALEKVLSFKFQKVYLIGELGKMVKVAGGIFLTDSRVADARMEILASFAALLGVRKEAIARILDSSLTEEALTYLEEEGILISEFGHLLVQKIQRRVVQCTKGKVEVQVEVFSLRRGLLGKTGE